MKKIIVSTLVLVMAFAFTGCGSSSTEETVTYDSIYEEYSAKIKEAGTKAVKEFKEEAADETDVTELATLANNKVLDIANVQVEGGTKMAELMTKNGDEYSKYENAYKKLYSVYNDEGMKVYSAYMDRYADTVPGMTDSMKKMMLESFESGMESMAPITEDE